MLTTLQTKLADVFALMSPSERALALAGMEEAVRAQAMELDGLILLDTVALLVDVNGLSISGQQIGLFRGQVGTVLEAGDAGVVLVEFAGVDGVAYAVATIARQNLLRLHHEIHCAQAMDLAGSKTGKPTVDQMIGLLTPDRQKAVLAKAEKITQARTKARQQEQALPVDPPLGRKKSRNGHKAEGC